MSLVKFGICVILITAKQESSQKVPKTVAVKFDSKKEYSSEFMNSAILNAEDFSVGFLVSVPRFPKNKREEASSFARIRVSI